MAQFMGKEGSAWEDKLGATLWEKLHPKEVAKEKEMTKKPAPAGEDRKIEKEDKTKRRKSLDKRLEDAGG